MISLVSHKTLDDIFPLVKEFIESAMRRGIPTHSILDVYDEIKNDRFNLWVASNDNEMCGAAVTRIDSYPLSNICNVIWLGGKNHQTWLDDMIEELEEFGKLEKCDFMVAVGRKGWIRRAGYMDTSFIMTKILGE